MNITPATAVIANGLNWFSQQELEWGCFHYVTIAYVVPVISVIGCCENLIIFYVLYYLKTGVGESARLYYALLAIFNIGNIILLHLAAGWSTLGLHFATQGRFFLSETLYNEVLCKIYFDIYIPVNVLLMWTYVLFNTERVVAIAFPLKAKILFSVSRNLLYVAIVGALGVVLMLYCITLQGLSFTLDVLGPIGCLPSSPSLTTMIFYEIITNAGMFTLPPALSLLLGIILFVVIRRQMAARSHLLNKSLQSNGTSTSSATTGGVVVIIMAIVHSAINLPAGIFGCFYSM